VIEVVPALSAVTRPVVEFTEATVMLLLLQLPPASPLLVNVAVLLIQSCEGPETVPAEAFGLTVSEAEAVAGPLQPVFV
jgi:hypothetical protein